MIRFPDQVFQVAPDIARADFYFFTRWMFANRRGFAWQRGPHHELISRELMKVFTGETKNLIINIPPRYSKTQLLCDFIAWCLGQVPDAEFIYTSYSGDLAANNSWGIKETLQHPEYHRIFPETMLRADSQARAHWRTSAGGVVYAAGMGGTLTGMGAGKRRDGFTGFIAIDDPHKIEEIRSEDIRKGVPVFYQETLQSRRNGPDTWTTPIILIMQRLHEEDLAGWLQAGGGGDKWRVVRLPALAEDNDILSRAPGEPLWPAAHTAQALQNMQVAMPFMFAGQYQQRPTPLTGGIFRPDQIMPIPARPAGRITWCRGWDLGATDGGGDPTAGGLLGLAEDGRLIIGDMVRGSFGPDARDAVIENTARGDTATVKASIPQDPGQAGKTQVLYLSRKLSLAVPGIKVVSSPESGDKITRAEPFAAQVNVGNVSMVAGPWNAALMDEMRLFPNGKHDDQIDALSRAYAELIAPRRSFFG